MKWTTMNVKNPNYTGNHEIYVGTQTGSFKKLMPAYEQNPFAQKNLSDVSKLDKDSRISALAFGNGENSEILIGRGHNNVQLHSLRSEQVVREVQLQSASVVGVARFGDQLVAGFGNGQLQRISLEDETTPETGLLLSAGDDMAHLRQCAAQRNLVATGGKGRQNNLKVFDMEAGGKSIFSSKNLPNDFLQLEVPVWDCDVAFIDGPNNLATCSRYGYVRVYDTRTQRRPVQHFASEEPQMSFATLAARGNYIYTGTTMGGMKAFDTRRLKNFVHTYKGFTGSIADLQLDASGKYLVSASLDRYVRVHHADSTVLLYQCYVKSKATRVLIRDSMENPNNDADAQCEDAEEQTIKSKGKKTKNKSAAESEDEEYDEIFDNMQTVCEIEEATVEDEVNEDQEAVEEDETQIVDQTKTGSKRKSSTKTGKNKKKKN